MLEEVKILLGDSVAAFTDEQIGLCLKQSIAEVEAFCNRELDYELEVIAEKITIIKLNRMGTEGLNNQSFTGVSESYINGYPQEILSVLSLKRKKGSLKVV